MKIDAEDRSEKNEKVVSFYSAEFIFKYAHMIKNVS